MSQLTTSLSRRFNLLLCSILSYNYSHSVAVVVVVFSRHKTMRCLHYSVIIATVASGHVQFFLPNRNATTAVAIKHRKFSLTVGATLVTTHDRPPSFP